MTIESVSEELIEAMEPTPKEIAEMAARYEALRQAQRVTADGDVLSEGEYQKERDYLNATLKAYIDKHGALDVEGIGELRIQDSHETVYDLAAIAREDELTFRRLLELGCLTVNAAALAAQIKAKQIGDPGHAMKMLKARALNVNKR